MLSVTPIYAILLTLLFLTLSVRVIIARRTEKIAYGSGENTDTVALIRAQQNCAEYIPIALLLLLMAELQDVGSFWLHICGLTFTIGRYLHGYAMGFNRKFFFGRVGGTALTLTGLGLLVFANILGLF